MIHLFFPSDPTVVLLILLGAAASIALSGFLLAEEARRAKHLTKETPTPPPPPEFANHECPECGHSLAFIAQYNRWYCYNCAKYP
jgi:hypothetical protein